MAPASTSLLLVIGFATCIAFALGQGCDPSSDHPNACYNADGSAYICCGPESCPSSTGPVPLCATSTSSQPARATSLHCDPNGYAPNQCYDASGTSSVCCAGQCGGNDQGNPTCAPVPPSIDGQPRGDLAAVNLVITLEGIESPDFNSTLQAILIDTLKSASPDILAVTFESIRSGSIIASIDLFFEKLGSAALQALTVVQEVVLDDLAVNLDIYFIKPVLITGLKLYVWDGISLPEVPPLPFPISEVNDDPCSKRCPYTVDGNEICGRLCCRYFDSARCPAFPDDPNGCGDKANEALVPAVIEILGKSEEVATLFSPLCDLHDICYGTPGRPKSDCDDELYFRSLNACLELPDDLASIDLSL
ncbi:hypothetical protein KFL_000760015 [Klebsormidium nitens]|uniref:Uncharacterized protein n=1 Tax=Klebsormidium nitens TaxID=105231 RepID=A0A1Y1HTV4_KLENI|nr:hypothetical protein KFL_000760015 [Klebsormidium nitens]|eukprot:GAQ81272.1 hypothetical protein KFL_000760015 [Klebsormidium nitens]